MHSKTTVSRRFFQSALALALLGPYGLGAPARAAEPAPDRRPNLVVIVADQLRYQSVGYAGDKKAQTPHIDRLATQGVSFRNAVSSTPVCAPFRASLFTGKYSSSTGMVVNELRISPEHECFAHVLNRAGYQTGFIGKLHLWSNVAGKHDTVYNQFVPPGPYRLGFDGLWAAYNYNHLYYKNWYHRDTAERLFWGEGVYEPDGQTDMAIDFLRHQAKGKAPFALFLMMGTPHDPWTRDNVPPEDYAAFEGVDFPLPPNWSDAPDPYADRFTEPDRWLKFWKPRMPGFQRVYYAMTRNLDRNVGRLMAALNELKLADDTIVVFTSDHGEMFGAHGRAAKLTFYEEAIRVPFLIRWPGRIPAGTVSDACLGSPDIMPTLLSLMGLPVPEAVEGVDLSHLALGRTGPEPEAAFLQGMGHTYLWKDGHEWRALRDKRYTYAIYRVDQSELLFDHQADPLQMKNLASDPAHQKTLERFRGMLKSRMAELNDTFEVCTWYRDHWTIDRNIIRGARGGSHDLDALREIIRKHFPPAEQPK